MKSSDDAKMAKKMHPMPFTRIEVVVLSIIDSRLHVLLAKRAEAPYAGKWALPGGVVRIDLDGSLESAAKRVVAERLGMELPDMEQLCAVGGPKRDPRAAWALSIVFRALVRIDKISANPGKRIKSLTWCPVSEAATDRSLAFDHADLIERAVKTTRAQTNAMKLPAGLLEKQFTLSDLQTTCEQILELKLDKSSFRRKLDSRDLVVPVAGATKGGAFRPAQLYRLT